MRPQGHDGTLVIDDLVFELRRSRRRRTIGITVERDGRLRVAAPAACRPRQLEETVRGKLPWVRRKLAEFQRLGPAAAAPRLVDGARLPYLGRTYRLALVDRPSPPVALRRGRLELARGLDGEARAHLVRWYCGRLQERVERRVAFFTPLVGAAAGGIQVRDLGRRWGSCSSRTRIVRFHWELATLPPDIVDYVAVHELTHLLRPDHSPAFWAEVGRVLPDWRARRRRLNEQGRRPVI